MKLLVVVAFGLFALASAQAPTPCDTPPQWHCRRFRYERERAEEIFEQYSYDATNERTRHLEKVLQDGNTVEVADIIRLYKENVEYFVDLQTPERTCTKVALDRSFRYRAVPGNATSRGELTIGTSSVVGGGLLVDIFEGEADGGGYEITVSNKGCVPVSDVFIRGDEVEFNDFFDVILGVDANVFIPPDNCQ